MRQRFKDYFAGSDPYFRWRSRDVTRIEGFSDAAFAFALTLLVVSLEVPDNFAELFESMQGLGAFAVCFALLCWVWYQHYLFFQRYGLADLPIIWLNGVLLFLVLFYVYPLKFMFNVLFAGASKQSLLTYSEVPWLFTIYGLGFLTIFLVLGLMHLYAWRKREELELDAAERAITRYEIRFCLINTGVAALSIAAAWASWPKAAGWVYFSLAPAHAWHGWISGRKVRRLAGAS